MTLLSTTLCQSAGADELILAFGGGPQPDSGQVNQTIGLDYSFHKIVRSDRQTIHLGVSYTYLKTNFGSGQEVHAISVYPQVTLYPQESSWINKFVPARTTPYFFVRALGPSYISSRHLGDREQSEHFTFQAQFGAGVRFESRTGLDSSLSLSWKHFSNADLFSDNEGFDFPIVLSLGVRF